MSKPIIAIDVDDVLYPTNKAMMEFVNEHFGTSLTWEDYQVHAPYWGYWEHVWKISDEEAQHRYDSFVKSGALASATATEGAITVISELEKNYDLVVVTARRDNQIDVTHEWLEKHFPTTFKDVQFVPVWDKSNTVTKGMICKEIGASYLIDDNIEHCMLAAEEGITCLLFGDYGWNYSEDGLPEQIHRVKDWQEVREYFDGRG